MADRHFFEVQALNSDVKLLSGSFKPNGSSAVDNTANTGSGYTVARTGTGEFTITLSDAYSSLAGASVSVALNSAAATMAVLGAVDVSSARTIVVTLLTESAGSFAAADVAANANNRVHFMLALKNNSRAP